MNNVETITIQPSSMSMFRADLTYYREGWGGNHELKTGLWAAPTLHREVLSRALNDGFTLERVRQRDPNNPAAGTVAFQRRFQSPLEVETTRARDHDIAVYVQDNWKPGRATHVEFRCARRLRAPIRRRLRRRADEQHEYRAAFRRRISDHIGCAQRPARFLRSRPRAGQRPRSDHDLRPDVESLPARYLRRQWRRRLRDRGHHAGSDGRDQRPRVRLRPAPAVRRRVRGGLREAVRRTDQPGSVVQPALLQGRLRRGRHQRHLSERHRISRSAASACVDPNRG